VADDVKDSGTRGGISAYSAGESWHDREADQPPPSNVSFSDCVTATSDVGTQPAIELLHVRSSVTSPSPPPPLPTASLRPPPLPPPSAPPLTTSLVPSGTGALRPPQVSWTCITWLDYDAALHTFISPQLVDELAQKTLKLLYGYVIIINNNMVENPRVLLILPRWHFKAILVEGFAVALFLATAERLRFYSSESPWRFNVLYNSVLLHDSFSIITVQTNKHSSCLLTFCFNPWDLCYQG